MAIISFSGEVILLKSKKEMGLAKVISEISKIGKPYVVATDKSSAPEFVRKIAANYGAILFVPEEDISLSFKKEIAKKFELKDDHQRDALSAALFAYKKLRPRIVKIKKELRDRENELIGKMLTEEYNASELKKSQITESDEIKRLKKEIEKTKRLLRELKIKLKNETKNKRNEDRKFLPDKSRLKELELELKKTRKELLELENQHRMIERLLVEVVSGNVGIFQKRVPSGYFTILKLGDIYFAREKSSQKSIDEKKLEQMLREYRDRKWGINQG